MQCTSPSETVLNRKMKRTKRVDKSLLALRRSHSCDINIFPIYTFLTTINELLIIIVIFSYIFSLQKFCQFILDDHWKSFFTKLFREKRIIELGECFLWNIYLICFVFAFRDLLSLERVFIRFWRYATASNLSYLLPTWFVAFFIISCAFC